jgi:hypothetical protein
MIEIDNLLDVEPEEIDAMRRKLKELTELILSSGNRIDIDGELLEGSCRHAGELLEEMRGVCRHAGELEHQVDAGELEGDPDPHDTNVGESLQEDPQ